MTGLLVATIQVSAILVAALILMWLLRKSTASLRHAVMVAAMTCAAIVPLLSLYMPKWPQGIVPSIIETRPAPVPALTQWNASAAIEADVPRPESPAPGRGDVTEASAIAAVPAPMSTSVSASAQVSRWRDSLPRVLDIAYAIYIAGVIGALMALTFGLLRLRWISARATSLQSNRWQRRAAAIAFAFGLRRPVHLAHTSRPVLATWGFARPQVLLPADAEDWPDDRVRAVLLHELAHIRRNDWIIQVLAGVLRSIYWFNPLVWMMFARLRQESEQACDDAAIQQGEDQISYAGQLLTLARCLNGGTNHALAAPSMALRSTLTRRIAVVLDPATPHAPASRASLAVISALMLVITCAIAACGSRATDEGITMPAETPPEEVAASSPVALSAAQSLPTPVADDTPDAANVAPPASAESRKASAAAPDSRHHPEPRPPGIIAADILDLMQSALADESLAQLDEIQRPITGLHHVQRYAQFVVQDEQDSPAAQAANYTEIINALKNTATFASNVTLAPRGAQLPKQKIDQLVVAMRARAEELADAVMPLPRVTTVNVSTPERRVAISALDLAQTTLRNNEFVGPRSNSWLVNELDTLERAAQSVLSDDGADQDRFATKLYALRSALLSTARNANDIARRPRVSPDVLGNATALSASVRRIANQLEAAMTRPWNPDAEERPGT